MNRNVNKKLFEILLLFYNTRYEGETKGYFLEKKGNQSNWFDCTLQMHLVHVKKKHRM